jgi:hypothetical protein
MRKYRLKNIKWHAIFIKLLPLGGSQFYVVVNHKLNETK